MAYLMQFSAVTGKDYGITPTNRTTFLLKNRTLPPLLPAGGTTDPHCSA